MVKKIIIIIIFIFITIEIFGFVWVYDKVLDSERDIEKLYNDNYIDYETYLNLKEIFRDKIDLNNGSIEEFIRVPHLDRELAKKIVDMRKDEKFKSVKDLQKIDILDDYRYKRIIPFLEVSIKDVVDDRASAYIYEDKSYFKNQFFYRNVKAFFSINYNNEIEYYKKNDYYYLKSNQKQIDLDSLFFSYSKENILLIGGDYRIKIGEGLMISNGSYYGRNEIRDNLTRQNYLRGVGVRYQNDNLKLFGFYSGYKKEYDHYVYNINKEEYEKTTLANLYWEETRGLSIQYQNKNKYIGTSIMHYFNKKPNDFKNFMYYNLYYKYEMMDNIDLYGEGVYSDEKYALINRLIGEYNEFYFNISYFTRNKNLYLPFFYKSKRNKEDIFSMKIKHRYKDFRLYSKFESEIDKYKSDLKYYGKVNYDFNDIIDCYFKYYNNNGDSFYSSAGIEVNKDNIDFENELKKYSDNDINYEIQLGYDLKILDFELGIDYKGKPEEKWRKKLSSSVSLEPIDGLYASIYYYKVYGDNPDQYSRIYIRAEI